MPEYEKTARGMIVPKSNRHLSEAIEAYAATHGAGKDRSFFQYVQGPPEMVTSGTLDNVTIQIEGVPFIQGKVLKPEPTE